MYVLKNCQGPAESRNLIHVILISLFNVLLSTFTKLLMTSTLGTSFSHSHVQSSSSINLQCYKLLVNKHSQKLFCINQIPSLISTDDDEILVLCRFQG